MADEEDRLFPIVFFLESRAERTRGCRVRGGAAGYNLVLPLRNWRLSNNFRFFSHIIHLDHTSSPLLPAFLLLLSPSDPLSLPLPPEKSRRNKQNTQWGGSTFTLKLDMAVQRGRAPRAGKRVWDTPASTVGSPTKAHSHSMHTGPGSLWTLDLLSWFFGPCFPGVLRPLWLL